MKSGKISEFLQSKIDGGDFPSAVYLVAEKGEIIFQGALGLAVVEPEKIEAKIDTIYDLASLTKVLVTGLLCAKLLERGEINLSERISNFFGEFDSDEKSQITIENLITHTSGFKAWSPFYLSMRAKKELVHYHSDDPNPSLNAIIIKDISEILLENPTGSKVVYSDLNFLLLGFLLEKLHDANLNDVFASEIVIPLELKRTFVGGLDTFRKETAASEFGNAYEKQICSELGYDVSRSAWRDYQIWGEVHDNNCYFMSGVSGHAGLFSTAEEILKIAQQFLPNQTTLLKPETCELFRKNLTPGLNQARSIAFQLAETPDSTASEALSKDSFGHLGFTGTSLWIEPSSEQIFILLTNRTHDRELPFADLKLTRQNFHRLAAEILDGK